MGNLSTGGGKWFDTFSPLDVGKRRLYRQSRTKKPPAPCSFRKGRPGVLDRHCRVSRLRTATTRNTRHAETSTRSGIYPRRDRVVIPKRTIVLDVCRFCFFHCWTHVDHSGVVLVHRDAPLAMMPAAPRFLSADAATRQACGAGSLVSSAVWADGAAPPHCPVHWTDVPRFETATLAPLPAAPNPGRRGRGGGKKWGKRKGKGPQFFPPPLPPVSQC